MKTVKIDYSEPIVVSQAPEHIREWGYWQFPVMEINEEGHIFIEFHINRDEVAAYGKPKAVFCSKDGGDTWEATDNNKRPGIVLKNGDSILISVPPCVSIDRVKGVAALNEYVGYGIARRVYRIEEMPEDLSKWYILRKRKGTMKYEKEEVNVNVPGYLMRSFDDLVLLNFFIEFSPMPDGGVCGMLRGKRETEKGISDYISAQFVVSYDNGHNWEMISEIEYEGDEKVDPKAKKRLGVGEQSITYLPDGSVLCLLRSTDSNGPGPTYYAKSMDNMKSWSKPKYFDDIGVWPRLLTLDNGITLSAYGRPGVRIRATADPSGIEWDDPIEIPLGKKADEMQLTKDSCSYADLIPTGHDTALLVYSDFNYPDQNGAKRKSILVRKIKVTAV